MPGCGAGKNISGAFIPAFVAYRINAACIDSGVASEPCGAPALLTNNCSLQINDFFS
jgi:hypothetical protein